MKNIKRTIISIAAITFILSISFAVQASHQKAVTDPEPRGIMANYYAANPTSVDELKEEWGNPIHLQTYSNGISKWTFGPYDSTVGYTAFLSKNGMVVDKNFTGADKVLDQLRNRDKMN